MAITRNWHIDLVKTIAMTLVVMQHAWSMLELDVPSLGFVCGGYRAIVTVGVPLFVFASGVLLLNRDPEPLGMFYTKRLKRILIPFVILALVMYIISIAVGLYGWWDGNIVNAIQQFIPSLLENKINISHWFVHMLLALYIVTPFLQHTLHKLSKREIQGVLLVWTIGMVLRQIYPNMSILAYTSALWTYLGVYIAGYYVSKYAINNVRYLYIGIICTFILYAIGAFTDCVVKLNVPLTAIFLGMTCLNIPTYTIHTSVLGQFITKISRYSYTIYLLHVMAIRAIYMLTITYIPISLIPFIPLIITPLIIIIFYVFCTIYDKIRWLPNNIIGIG